jgi:hypothetical protein
MSKIQYWLYVPEDLGHPRFSDRPPIGGKVLAEMKSFVPLGVLNTWDDKGRCVVGTYLIREGRKCTRVS